MKTIFIVFLVFIFLTVIGPLWIFVSGQIDWKADYRTANRASAHIAPDPSKNPEAIIEVYSARAFNWRGLFSTHNWIAAKPKDAPNYIVYQVIGWRKFHGLSPLLVQPDIPDRYWFGEKPRIVFEIRGELAEKLIPQIFSIAQNYPDVDKYEMWPGPNSNTFPAYIGRQLPEMGLTMPPDAIGKDYLIDNHYFSRAPSGTGYQFSIHGLFGILIARKEGFELNILGLVYGIQLYPFAIKLPGIGSIP